MRKKVNEMHYCRSQRSRSQPLVVAPFRGLHATTDSLMSPLKGATTNRGRRSPCTASILALIPVLMLTSCRTAERAAPSSPGDAAVPAASVSIEVPEKWTAKDTPGGTPLIKWWTQFNDPVLDDLVEEALKSNQDLRRAAARMDSAAALAKIAGADLKPRVGAGVSGSRSRQPVLGQSTTGNRFGVSLDLSWEIDLWGRLRAGKRAAAKDVEVARAGYSAARLSLIAQTVKAAFAVAELRQHVNLAESTVKTYRDSQKVVQDRFNRGVGKPVDVRLSSANLASAEGLLKLRKAQLDRAVRQFEILLGRYPKGAMEGKAALPPLPSPVPAGLPSELLARRPDLVEARYRVFAADDRIAEAKAALLPRMSLTASGGTTTDAMADLLSGSSAIWQAASNLFQPIFEGGRLRANVELQKSRSQEALAAYVGVALNAFREVESALAAEELLDGREADMRRAVEHAAEARRLAQDRYRSGLGNILEVLEAQRREFDTQSQLLATRRERLDNRINLHLALGGGYEEQAATP